MAEQLRPGVDVSDRRVVVDCLGVHRADDADLVCDPGGVGKEIGVHPGAAFADLLEVEHRGDAGKFTLAARHAGDALSAPD